MMYDMHYKNRTDCSFHLL